VQKLTIDRYSHIDTKGQVQRGGIYYFRKGKQKFKKQRKSKKSLYYILDTLSVPSH